MCRFHKRRDGQITIHSILSERKGAGREIIEYLKSVPDSKSLFAKCPQQLESNGFYKHMGFVLERKEVLKTGTVLNHWRLTLQENL